MYLTAILDETRLNQLKLFGLTYLQAKVYVSTYLLGETPVKKIMELCQMHKVEVYRVLKELEKLGAVDRVIAHPVRYRARRPEEVLKNLLLPHVKRLAELSEVKAEVLEWFRSLRLTEHDERRGDDGFELLQGRLVLKRIAEMIDRASDEILYISRAYEDAVKSEVSNTFNRAIERGVKARGILNVTKQYIDIVKRLKNSRQILRRHNDKVYLWIIIVDGREMIFGSAPRALPDEEFLYTRNRRFIRHYIRTFELLFEDSIPIEDRIQEIEEIPQPTMSSRAVNYSYSTNF